MSTARRLDPLADPKVRKVECLGSLDLAAEAKELGIVFTRVNPNPSGYRECRALGREDRKPSAAFNVRTGHYKDLGSGESLGFFDLAMKHGRIGDGSFTAVWRHYMAKAGLDRPAVRVVRPDEPKAEAPKRTARGQGYATHHEAIAGIVRQLGGEVAGLWWYVPDAFAVGRLDGTTKKLKDYRPIHRGDDGRWHAGDPPGPLPLYNRAALDARPDEIVAIFEGEKCAALADHLGILATTSAHGASSAHKSDWGPLAGRRVVIAPDAGPAGADYLARVRECLDALPTPPAEVRVLALPGLDDGEDVVEWCERLPDLWDEAQARAEFWRLAEAAAVVPPAGPKAEVDGLDALSDADLGIVAADQVEPERVEYQRQYRLALGKFTLDASEGGMGKSQNAAYDAKVITTDGDWGDGSPRAAVGNVLILAAEDGMRDTIIPRLMAAGADRSKVRIITAKVTTKDKAGRPLIDFKSFQDLAYWEQVIDRVGDVRLLVADPIPAYLGRGVNDHRNNDVRAVLEPFIQMLDERRVALKGITHLGKSIDQKDPVHKILGSVAYANLARFVNVHCLDPDDRDRRILCQVKNNLGPRQKGLAYRIEGVNVEWKGQAIETSKVVFEQDAIDADAADLMAAARDPGKRRGPSPEKTTKVAEWLFDFLAERHHPTLMAAIFDAAGEMGFVGQKKADGKWSIPANLYRAKEHVAKLDGDRAGWRVDDFEAPFGGVGRNLIHWQLNRADAPF